MADAFWENIHKQSRDLCFAQTADDVFRICPPIHASGEATGGDGFFEGSGGDYRIYDSLLSAGWHFVWRKAYYHWCMEARNGDRVTYVEGDLYRGDRHGNTTEVAVP